MGREGNGEKGLKWGGGRRRSLRNLSKSILTLNRPAFCRLVWLGGGGGEEEFARFRNFCLNGPIDLKFGM